MLKINEGMKKTTANAARISIIKMKTKLKMPEVQRFSVNRDALSKDPR